MADQLPRVRSALRPLYFFAGCLLLCIGIAGYILPLLPGTVFLILAAACFARSSRRFETWLLTHPKLGPSIVAWRQNGAIPRKAKILALSCMAISFAIVLIVHASTLGVWISAIVLGASALFVATRPGVPVPPPQG
jgi:uncharacterized protein